MSSPRGILADHPRLLTILAGLLFSTAAPVSRFVSLGPLGISFFRCLVGLFALPLFAKGFGCRELKAFRISDFIGGTAYAATSLSFFIALNYTTAANATVLFQTSPVFIIPLGYLLLRERSDRWDYAAIALMLTGIILCFREGLNTDGSIGDLAALGGALAFSLMNIRMRHVDREGKVRMLMAGNFLLVLITMPFLFGTVISGRDILLSGSLGVVHMALPFLLYGRALEKLRALEGAVYKNAESVFAPLWVGLLVKEVPGPWTIGGFLLIMGALVLRAWAPTPLHRSSSA